MSWHYNVEQVGTVDLMTVRYLIGDVDSDEQLAQDEELEYCMASNSSIYYAAAQAAEAIAARFAKEVAKTVGPLSRNLGERSVQYEALAKRLRSTAGRKTATAPLLFGNSYAEKESDSADTDKIGTAIKIGGMDNPSLAEDDDRVRYF
jgi:prophage antirepressor-like protein